MAAGDNDTPFPRDWRITALWSSGQDKPRAVSHGSVTDSEIANADAIVVRHKNRDTGVEVFRTVHGADSKSKVGDVIDRVVKVVSPPRKGRTR